MIDRTLCKTCAFQEYYPSQKPCLVCLGGSPLRVTGERYLKDTPTNGDYIRKMSDEELAECFWNICETHYKSEQEWLEWLKKEKDDG